MHFFKSRASSFKICSDRIVIYSEIGSKKADFNAGASAVISKELVLSGILQVRLMRSFINGCEAGEMFHFLLEIMRQQPAFRSEQLKGSFS